MSVSKETESEILRLLYVEKWKRGTIARQLNIHHGVVDRVLLRNGIAIEHLQVRPAMIDPYVPFIRTVWPAIALHFLKDRLRQQSIDQACSRA
jgi:hypothetical protein